jgi:uncharacterized membrane protein (DUF4010 family)
MDADNLILRLAVALGIGLLIGLERGWRAREDAPGMRTAGIRTFSLTGLLGGIAGALTLALGGAANPGGGIFLGLAFMVFSAVFAVFCRDENRAEGTFSVTTTVAGMLTFVLGAYALLGDASRAASAAVAAAVLLAMRERLHGLLKRISEAELRAALILLTMTFIALPLWPDESIGPFGGINPREIWLIAIVLAGVSFLGYVAVKELGPSHGVLVASVAGGLVSSTAVTVANARLASSHADSSRLLAGGVAAATAVCFLRVIAIVAVLKPDLLILVAPPLLVAAVTALAFSLLFIYWRSETEGARQIFELRNPFSFWPVIGFAISLGVIILVARAVGELFGAAGAIVGAVLVGLFDVDSVTISMVRLVPAPLSPLEATFAILAAVVSDTLSKIAIGGVIGRGRFAVEISIFAVACIATGAAMLWFSLRLLRAV